MSQSASQAAAFRRDLATHRKVWTIEDDNGFPAPEVSDGKRSMPFWSTRDRAERIIGSVAAYEGFRPSELSLQDFERYLDELAGDGVLVGVNWSGANATGYDVEPDDVRGWLEAMRERGELPAWLGQARPRRCRWPGVVGSSRASQAVGRSDARWRACRHSLKRLWAGSCR